MNKPNEPEAALKPIKRWVCHKLECFTDYLKTCTPAKVTSEPLGGGSGLMQINGLVGDTCEVYAFVEGNSMGNGEYTCLVPEAEYTQGTFSTGILCPGVDTYCSGSLVDEITQFNVEQGNCGAAY